MNELGLKEAFGILGILILCAVAFAWMVDDYRNDGKDR